MNNFLWSCQEIHLELFYIKIPEKVAFLKKEIKWKGEGWYQISGNELLKLDEEDLSEIKGMLENTLDILNHPEKI